MVSIITVNYNGYKDTLELVESFRQFEDYPHEFIVVDNASPNGDGERLERALGDTTRVIRSDKNLGFAGANNLGRSEERRVGKECRSRWSPYH